MKYSFQSAVVLATALVCILAEAGCSAGASKARHLANGKKYYAAGELEKAELEYINVLQAEERNPEALAGLGLIYFDEGRYERVFTFLSLARDLQPNNLEVRSKLATVYLGAGQLQEAHNEALFVLEHRPDDPDAPIELAQTVRNAPDILELRQRLKALPGGAADRPAAIIANGLLDLRQGNAKSAEAAFERARTMDPKSVNAHLALVALYQSRREMAKAEQAFATAANLSPIRSGTRTQYAQLELQLGHADVAKKVLTEIVEKAPDAIPAYIALAEMAANDQKLDDALTLIDKALAKDSSHPDAIMLKARVRVAKGEADKAVADLESAVKLYPSAPQLFYQYGLAANAAGDLPRAVLALSEAIRLQPDYPAASLVLADLQTRQGNTLAAGNGLKQLALRHPELPQVRLALANVYTRQGNLEGALAIYREFEKQFPKDPQPCLFSGILLLQQNKLTEARQAFERALLIAPDHLPSLEQLVTIDVFEKKFEAAHRRVSGVIEKDPKSADAYLLQAKVYLAEDDTKNAETMLQKVISLHPDQATPYVMLARLYIATHQQEKAITNLQQAAKNDPKDVDPLMLIAVLNEQQKNYAGAREYYEKVVALNPRFSAALNNLAYLYSEYFNELDKGFEMAQKARELLPHEPHTADTLGWIVYKRGQYPWALTLLTESADKLPTSADVQFHVGMTHFMLGEEGPAKAALSEALKLNPKIAGAEQAQQALSVLSFDAAKADDQSIAALEKAAAARPDPVSLTRLGAVYERKGEDQKAITAYEAALKQSPNNMDASVGAIRAYRHRGDTVKAFALAKAARKLAPADPDVAQSLGELAFATGDFSWASSLLQEAARSKSADPELQYSLARAAFYAAQLTNAQSAVKRAVESKESFSHQKEAKDLLELTDIAIGSSDGQAALPKVEATLKADPKSAPALMALGRIRESQHDTAGALQTYGQLLSQLPDFYPAARQMALLLTQTADNDTKALDLATKAREGFANDPELTKAFGVLAYRQHNYSRAATLLEESARNRPADGEVLYYLGMAQDQLKSRAASVKSLQKALELDLKPDFAAKAREIIARGK